MEHEIDGTAGASERLPSPAPLRASSSCPLAESCGLPAALTRVALLLWQGAYCDRAGGHERCARFQVARGGQPVPEALLPTGAQAPRAA